LDRPSGREEAFLLPRLLLGPPEHRGSGGGGPQAAAGEARREGSDAMGALRQGTDGGGSDAVGPDGRVEGHGMVTCDRWEIRGR